MEHELNPNVVWLKPRLCRDRESQKPWLLNVNRKTAFTRAFPVKPLVKSEAAPKPKT